MMLLVVSVRQGQRNDDGVGGVVGDEAGKHIKFRRSTCHQCEVGTRQ